MCARSSSKGSREFWNFSRGFLAGNAVIALLITLFICPSCSSGEKIISALADDFLISFILSTTLSYGGFLIEDYFDQRISWIEYPVKRLLLECLCYLIYVFAASFSVIFVYSLIVRQSFTLGNIPWKELVQWTKFPMRISFIVSFIFISRSFLMEWRKTAIEAEQLKAERFASQYQSLKDQLNPHFLFNSLNVLSNLVYENPDTSAKFIRQLSRIYRYVLDVQQEELVPLEKEMEFAENYLALQKIRFEEGLVYHIHVGENVRGSLPPLSLQLLLENAIKHNVASKQQPLVIEIRLVGDELIVENNLQPRSSLPEESAGVGLANVSKRYELLSDKKIAVLNNGNTFTVKLPILTP
ncbi:sensor histidine kinase [Dyadobacter sp. CY261]|uniref:sensor histidine kinase n=1 Tax=Dyadobacter sp. CY261 TaxID=2907203 RepID=UPI001F19255B|nr:sensor histidine kinase [Dyadobacter sp. CY261]MCF0073551.1 sensor histidine kinase [Dyadobacter sp. CY261]